VHRFGITWDYRCPFARNAHEHVVAGLRDGAGWDVRFVPFSLGQVHVADGDPDVWDDPARDSGLLALQAGVVVRDRWPERFPAVHLALFAARHDEGRRLQDPDVVAGVLDAHGIDATAVLDEVGTGAALATVRREHEQAVAGHGVWGVPTFLSGLRAAFVRLMDRPGEDTARGRTTVERILALLDGWPELNELKHTSLDR